MLAPLRDEPDWVAWKYPRIQRLVAPAYGKGKRGPSAAFSPADEPAFSPRDAKKSFIDPTRMAGRSVYAGWPMIMAERAGQEKVGSDTVEAGFMIRVLALRIGPQEPWMNTQTFLASWRRTRKRR
jgi:hypothetical protein